MHYTSTYLSVRITEWVCYKRETRTRDNISPAAKTHYFAILERERESKSVRIHHAFSGRVAMKEKPTQKHVLLFPSPFSRAPALLDNKGGSFFWRHYEGKQGRARRSTSPNSEEEK